jgi:hypothetical protein
MGKNGVIHFAAGIGGGDMQAGSKYILINRNGLIYWNTTMPMLKDSLNLDTLQAHGQLIGWYSDGSGVADTLNTVQSYRVGLTSHPQISIDATGNMIVLWDGITYQNPEPSTGNNYRHIWGRGWNYATQSWAYDQFDLNSDISYIFMEFVYPSMAKTLYNNKFDYIYQTANTPGSAVLTTTLTTKTCNIEHRQEPLNLLVNVGIPTHDSKKIFVGQNYPNPVNGMTSFNVNLDKASNVTTEVTNITGQNVMTLNNGLLSSGAHQLSINASQLTAGIYFYTVKIDGQAYTRKMIVQ